MTADDRGRNLADIFDHSHASRLQSPTLERIYRTAFGDEYPVDAQPNGFFTLKTLERLAGALGLGRDSTVVDLGCGHGGPSLWVAKKTGANLIGIDLSPVGVDLARTRAAELGLSATTRFQVGDLMTTGLAEASCDAAFSLDVLLYVPDKAAAVREVARILRPGGRFGFTTWEQLGYSPRIGAAQVADHRPLLEEAGFTVETYEEPPGWEVQHRALAEGVIAAEGEITKEMGPGYVAMARSLLADLPMRRYVFVVARRQ
jgi:SAM-dependent methyltransferase